MNLLSLLASLTKRDPHAIIAIDVDPDHPTHVSRTELWRRTLQLRADLATAGVGRGDAVLACVPGWSSLLDWYVASASLGAHVIAVDSVAATTGADVPGDGGDLAAVLERARPKVAAVAHTSAGTATVPALLRDALRRSEAPAPSVAVVTGPHAAPPVDPSPYDVGAGAWLPSAATAGMPMPETGGDELIVAFPPALAAYSESAVVRHAHATAAALDVREDDVVFCTRPPSEIVGFCTTVATALAGATCLLDPAVTPDGVPAELERFGVTHLVTDDRTAWEIERAWRESGRAPRTPSASATTPARSPWRHLGLSDGGAGLPDAARRAAATFGVPVSGLFGAPESLFPVTRFVTEPDAPDAPARPVSPEIEIRVADPASHRPVAAGEQGEVLIRGDNVAHAHLGTPDETAPLPREQDWRPTGTTGVLTADGGVRHLGPLAAGTG